MSIFNPGQGDIFRTQADSRFNSFSDPMNAVNMNPGQWGVDPNYLTPPYLSPFRPRYQGPSGPSYAAFRPSWSTSANQIFNPMAPGGENYGGNYMQQQSPYYDKFAHGPVDGAASFAQNLAVPAAASWFAYKYWGGPSTKIGRAIGGGLMSGIFRGAGVTGTAAATMGIRAGATLAGAAFGLGLPMLATEAAVGAVDKAVFDPYVAQRNMGMNLRENFRGISFGDGNGSLVNGGGLSRRSAARIAKQVSQSGAMDMTFTQEETSTLADYASRSGLMDNMNPNQMSSRFEGLLKQVKLVMAVANTSDFKETIEIMSKMQMGGVNGAQLSGVMGKLSGYAGAGGQSFQKLFNTVGTAGQYLFAGQGLTPYVGQESAFASSASMSAAFRSGLISPAMMARMGGMEGASQSAMAAQIASYRTPYATFQAHNAYMGKGDSGDVVGNVARFGGDMAANSLRNSGRFALMESALTSRHIQDRGVLGEQDRIYQIAKTMPNGIGPDGKVDAGVAYGIMVQTMGMTPEMARAKIAQFHSHNDPGTVKQMLAGTQTASVDALMKYNQQEGLNKGILTSPYNAIKRSMMGVQKAAAGAVGNVLETVGGVGDDIEKFMVEGLMGINPNDSRAQLLDETGVNQANIDIRKLGGPGLVHENLAANEYSDQLKDLKKINAMAKDRNGDAMQFLNTKATARERANALYKLTGKNGIKGDYTDAGQADVLMGLVGKMGVTEGTGDEARSNKDTLLKNLHGILPGKNNDESIEYINLMHKVSARDGDVDDATRARIAELKGVSPDSLSRAELKKMSGETLTNVGKGRMSHLIGLGKVGDDAGLVKALQEQRGGVALAPVVESSGDVNALRTQMEAQNGIAQSRAEIMKAHKEGKINTKDTMDLINGLDSKETVGKFDKAVDKFVSAVGNVGGDKTEPQSTASALWNAATGHTGAGRR